MRNNDFTDWNEFEKKMIEQFPFLPKDFARGDVAKNASWVSDYVQKSLDQFMNSKNIPNMFSPHSSSFLSYDVFETHRNLVVRIHLAENMTPRDVKTSMNRRMVRIELPSGKIQDIRLEKAVNPKRYLAKFKEGVLEIQIQKLREPKSFHDIYVDE